MFENFLPLPLTFCHSRPALSESAQALTQRVAAEPVLGRVLEDVEVAAGAAVAPGRWVSHRRFCWRIRVFYDEFSGEFW